MRLTRTILASSILSVMMAGAAAAQTKVDMIGFGGASNLPIWLAMDKGLFAKHGLEVKLDRTRGSEAQIKDMMAGKYQIASTSIDNIIGYTEGQGPIKIDNFDMVAFMGVHSGLNSVVTRPEIKTYADIKGKPVAVDAPNTGYAFVLFKILADNGLVLNRDYTLLAVGATDHRLTALKDGRAVAAVMSAPTDLEAKAAGYNILADAAAELGGYQGSVYGVRRGWAAQNEPAMLAFVRAVAEAHGRIFADKAPAKEVLMKRVKGLDEKGAETIYTGLTTGKGGLARKAEINVAGVKSVLDMRSDYAEPKKQLGDPQKYIDLSYYQKALG
jgi:ABC-type nitrate/sulfonate/bicarbonate transport system substrate-binding protein